MVNEQLSPIARVIQDLVKGGMSTETVGQLARLTGSQIRRLRSNEQFAASEDTVILLAKVAGFDRERSRQLLIDNALQRASQSMRQDFLHHIATAPGQSMAPGSAVVTAFDPAALRVARRDSTDPIQHAALLQSVGSTEHIEGGVWLTSPHCVYFSVPRSDLGLTAGSVVEVDLADQTLTPSGLYLICDLDHGPLPMTYIGTFSDHAHVFVSSIQDNGVYRAIDADTDEEQDVVIVGRISRVVHQSLRQPSN